ncbi:hypothetical protein [Chryseobacterium sp. MFBS3-17]|uniref:hypothetical protein n=1 Tax=Chryseobacterium sp. MFBS3-17 TaxID=2886689 RepID=UPI001D0E8853|nr:hypothetical protein [Chryseobacterium sp. MFBS3-17]MCC2590033.1 hypothetical protein [Chryseobacterium sp. MFBS3-17]
MYYLELIDRFWKFNQNNDLGSTAIAMYLFLLKTGYENNRYDFKISDIVTSKNLGVTRKTVKTTKEKLRNYGLIQFETKSGYPCYYRLILHYPLKVIEVEKQEKTIIERNSKCKSNDLEKTIRIRENESKSKNKVFNSGKTKSTVKNNDIPSLNDFIEYAKTLDSYNKSLDNQLKTKYESWLKDHWRNKSGKPISNWKSILKSILPYLINHDENKTLTQSIPSIKRPQVIA